MVCFVERLTIPSILHHLQKHFGDVENRFAGLLQVAFIVSFMIFAPLFGYLGDRYKRKYIIIFGILLCSVVDFGISYLPEGYNNFKYFLLARALVGVGQSTFGTLAPTIIADVFINDTRYKVLGLFYFAIPLGSGLGYIVGGQITHLFGMWQSSLRATSLFCAFGLCLLFFVDEPERGLAEGGGQIQPTAWSEDVRSLLSNYSFVAMCLGNAAVFFVVGAWTFWAPTFLRLAINVNVGAVNVIDSDESLVIGVVTCMAGLFGVIIGSESARRLRPFYNNCDPMICALAMLICTPLLYGSLLTSRFHTLSTYVLLFFGEMFLCVNWGLVANINMSLVLPTRRATASALLILFSHLFGDAGSPWIVGLMSDTIIKSRHSPDAQFARFLGLQYGLLTTIVVCAIGAVCFTVCGLTFNQQAGLVDESFKESEEFISSDDTSISSIHFFDK